jgi:hypothetical protein
VEAWVKENRTDPETFFSTPSRAGGARADFTFDLKFDLFTLDSVQKVIRFDIGDGPRLLASSNIPWDYQPQVWYYVAAVVTPSLATYYVNGAEVGSANYSGMPLLFDPAHIVQVGATTGLPGNNRRIAIVVDEVAIYNYALRSEQIVTHYLTGQSTEE